MRDRVAVGGQVPWSVREALPKARISGDASTGLRYVQHGKKVAHRVSINLKYKQLPDLWYKEKQ